jgi:hypothetical protein
MVHQEIYYPNYYGDFKQIVYAPRYYVDTATFHQTGLKHPYSMKLYFSKMGENQTVFFLPYVLDLIYHLKRDKLISNINFVGMVPGHKPNTISATVKGIALRLVDEFHCKLFGGINRNRIVSKSSDLANSEERHINVMGSIDIDSSIDLNNKNFLLLDDIKTTGFNIMEVVTLLKSRGCNYVFCIVLGINGEGDVT